MYAGDFVLYGVCRFWVGNTGVRFCYFFTPETWGVVAGGVDAAPVVIEDESFGKSFGVKLVVSFVTE